MNGFTAGPQCPRLPISQWITLKGIVPALYTRWKAMTFWNLKFALLNHWKHPGIYNRGNNWIRFCTPNLLRCVWYGRFQFSIVVVCLHLPVALIKWRERRKVKVKGRVWSQRLPFKCEETVLCGISMHFLILSSVCLLLPVTPTATITCHPSRHLSLFSLSTLPLHFLFYILACHLSSSSSPSSRPSVVVSPLFKFTPHKFPLVRTLPCPPSGGLPRWQVGWMIDKAWCLWAPPPLFETPHRETAAQ